MTEPTIHVRAATVEPAHRRRTRYLLALAVVLVAGTGCNHVSDPVTASHPSPDTLKALLDTVPKPPGAAQIAETASPGEGDRATTYSRTYQLTGSQPACVQLINAVTGTVWLVQDRLNRPLDPKTCDPAVANPTYTDPGNDQQRGGYLTKRSATLGGIAVEWRHDQLIFNLDEDSDPR